MNGVFVVLGMMAGACVGSFTATASLRAIRGEQSTRGRSRCDGCGTALTYAQTLPLISYAQLRGACPNCGSRIDPLHLLGECAGAVLVALAILLLQPVQACLVIVMGFVLMASSIIDGRTRRLPDRLTLVVAASGLLLAMLKGVDQLLVGAVAAIVTALVLLAVRALARRGPAPALGLGDVKLFSALAIWLGAWTPWMVAVAAMLGLTWMLVRSPPDRRIAFGPMIAIAAMGLGLAQEAGLFSDLS
ncbi:A24 family peptidase [Phenylobacterium sp.]|uniref:prepilin peptidase n=1 Tax=Phenylobacterium sp. TaxID=1871053 RepID=UPI00289F96EF|nr:A24 family peptidase [Phenylobacterium sp.]